MDAAAATLGLSVSTRLEIDSVGLLKDLARRGMGRAVLPFGAVREEVASGILSARPIVAPEVRSSVSLLYLADQPPTRLASRLIGLFVAILRDIVDAAPRHGFVEVRPRDGIAGYP
jgi:LysR family transcriptional regulator, nitrogen assimilation regulatory protein